MALGLVSERLDPRRTRACLAISALVIPLAMVVFTPELDTYRGLSGLTSALFGLLAVTLLRDQLRDGNRLAAGITESPVPGSNGS